MPTIAPPFGGASDPQGPVIVLDPGHRSLSVSPCLGRLLGLDPDAPAPASLSALMDADSTARVDALLRAEGDRRPEPVPLMLRARDGRPVPASAEIARGAGGCTAIAVSIHPGWPMEDAARLVERSRDMVVSLCPGPGLVFRYVNAASTAVTGYGPGELAADPGLFAGAVHPDDLGPLQATLADPGRLGSPVVFRFRHRDGGWRRLEFVGSPVVDAPGHVAAVEGIIRDVTGRREVEAALQEVNRRMNLLASLTRHDILNQLTVLLGALELARAAESDAELAWFLGRSREAAWAIQRLTEFTRDYQEIGQGAPRWVRVPELARRAAASFAGNGVVVEVAAESWEIRADPLIELVFYNLVENALRHGGRVSRITFSVQEEPSGGAVVACEDDGEGVPVNEKERIFERGYGRNSGLGLSLAAEILASTGMTIAETGRAGLGARFEIRVPHGACRRAREPPRRELVLSYR